MPAESSDNGIAMPVQLSWSHYERLIRVADPDARFWYMHEAATQQWDYRTLKRNIDSQYYYRLAQTPKSQRQEVIDEMHRFDCRLREREINVCQESYACRISWTQSPGSLHGKQT